MPTHPPRRDRFRTCPIPPRAQTMRRRRRRRSTATADADRCRPCSVDVGAPPVPLLVPSGAVAGPITERAELLAWARRLTAGPGGPVAIDAERASGFRYGSPRLSGPAAPPRPGHRAARPDRAGRSAACWTNRWPGRNGCCTRPPRTCPAWPRSGIRPRRLFDTELAGRLAGLPRVGLGPLVEQMLGLHLRKGHGAADWSTRPLPHDWLVYAALDVEVLVELRDAMEAELRPAGQARLGAPGIRRASSPRRRRRRGPDPWRRTSGMHRISDRRALAIVRELWLSRDALARRRDVAPHRMLPDSAIVAAAAARPTTVAALVALPVFSGRMQRRNADLWLAAISRALALPVGDLPPPRSAGDGPPAPAKWAAKDPAAAARLQSARVGPGRAVASGSARRWRTCCPPTCVRRVLWEPAATTATGWTRP